MKKTSLYNFHLKNNAKMVNFHGWNLPLYYTGSNNEHLYVRSNVGIFDVSHMGEIRIIGKECLNFLNIILTTDLKLMKKNQASYSLMLNNEGGIIDDVIAYKINIDEVLLCVNATNIDTDFQWLMKQKKILNLNNLSIVNESSTWGQIAIQGPLSKLLLSNIYSENIDMKKFHFKVMNLPQSNVSTIVARTGYTGEDGFEVFVKNNEMEIFLQHLENAKSSTPYLPCGLSARDSLRTEAGLSLHGQDITPSINPIESNLEWVVKYDKKDFFIGRQSLMLIKNNRTISRKLVGLKINKRKIARKDDKVYVGKECIGHITSGIFSPCLKYPIALAYLNLSSTIVLKNLTVSIRGSLVPCELKEYPFLVM